MTTASTFINSHIVGARLLGTAADGRMSWSAGWFNNWLDDALSFSESGNIFAGRLAGIAAESDGGKRLFHVGASVIYREAQNGSLKAKSVPEVYEAPDFIDPGTFPGNHSFSYGGELAAVRGPVTLSGELSSTRVSSPQTNNPHFLGWYVMASWCLTGETGRTTGPSASSAPSRRRSRSRSGTAAAAPGRWPTGIRAGPDERHRAGRPLQPFERRALVVPDEAVAAGVQLRLRHARPLRPHRTHELLPAPPAVPALSAPCGPVAVPGAGIRGTSGLPFMMSCRLRDSGPTGDLPKESR